MLEHLQDRNPRVDFPDYYGVEVVCTGDGQRINGQFINAVIEGAIKTVIGDHIVSWGPGDLTLGSEGPQPYLEEVCVLGNTTIRDEDFRARFEQALRTHRADPLVTVVSVTRGTHGFNTVVRRDHHDDDWTSPANGKTQREILALAAAAGIGQLATVNIRPVAA